MQTHNIRKLLTQKTSALKCERGMTLIDVSIILIIIGLLATPALYALKEYKRQRAFDVTDANIRIIDEAIRNYHITNDYYPCPADPTLAVGAPNYGTPAMAAPPACDFVTGSVPYAELGINIDTIYDGFGNKIAYAVSDHMAGDLVTAPALPPAPLTGALSVESISMLERPGDCVRVCANTISPFPAGAPNACTAHPLDFYAATPIETTPNIHYSVFSYGSDGVGARNENGTLVRACNPGTAQDDQNCDPATPLTFRADVNQCLFADVNTNQRYDDVFVGTALEKDTEPSNMFEASVNNPDGMGTTVNYTGINNDNPQGGVDIIGNIKIIGREALMGEDKTAAAQRKRYCDPSGANCFNSRLIGGRDPNMQCGSRGMAGIAFNSARCENRIPDTTPNGTCNATRRKVQSITIGGNYRCAD